MINIYIDRLWDKIVERWQLFSIKKRLLMLPLVILILSMFLIAGMLSPIFAIVDIYIWDKSSDLYLDR